MGSPNIPGFDWISILDSKLADDHQREVPGRSHPGGRYRSTGRRSRTRNPSQVEHSMRVAPSESRRPGRRPEDPARNGHRPRARPRPTMARRPSRQRGRRGQARPVARADRARVDVLVRADVHGFDGVFDARMHARVVPSQLDCAVIRGVVGDDELEIAEGLRQHRFDARRPIVARSFRSDRQSSGIRFEKPGTRSVTAGKHRP
jgi:hypothetical protein